MIDQDIARIYGVTTGRLNEQAKRNIARFSESFRFQLTKEERDEVIANCENLRSLKFYPSLPYAYTEQGIGRGHWDRLLYRIRLWDKSSGRAERGVIRRKMCDG